MTQTEHHQILHLFLLEGTEEAAGLIMATDEEDAVSRWNSLDLGVIAATGASPHI